MRRFKAHRETAMTALILLLPVLILFWEIILGKVLFWGTPLLQFVPWTKVARASIQMGEVPLWNPLVGNGAPLLANYQSALFYPPNWLQLVLPPAQALSWLMVLHVLWAGIGAWLFTGEIGLNRFARTLSALSFMLSGYLVSRLLFPSIGSALPWLPWLFWSAERLVRRRPPSPALLLGLCLGLQWLAGHAQISYYSGLALGGFLLWRMVDNSRKQAHADRWRYLVGAMAGTMFAFIIGCGLAAVQLLPTAELQQLSQRASGADYDFAMTYSLWPLRVISFFSPRFFGHPATGDFWGLCCNFWEDNGYVGLLPLILAIAVVGGWGYKSIAGLRHRHSSDSIDRLEEGYGNLIPFFALLSTVGLILAMGIHTPVFPFVFEQIPGFRFFQAPARLLVWWTFGISILAGIGAERWQPTPRISKLARYGIVLGLSLILAGFGSASVLEGKPITFVLGLLQLGVGLLIISAMALKQPQVMNSRPWWTWTLLLLLALDLIVADWGGNPCVEPWIYTRPTETAAILRQSGHDGRYYYSSSDLYTITFASPDAESVRPKGYLSFETFRPLKTEYWFGMREALVPNVGILDGIPSANNFDPLVSWRYQTLIDAVDQASQQDRLRLLRFMGVDTLVTRSAVPALSTIHESVDATFSAVPNPLPRAFLAYSALPASDPSEALDLITDPQVDLSQQVVLESGEDELLNSAPSAIDPVALTATANTVTIRAALHQDGYLVLLDSYYPGWRALVDKEFATIYPANLAFRAVKLSAGEHLVEFRYRPNSFTLGMLLTGLTCLIIAVFVAARIVSSRRKTEFRDD